MALAAEQVAEQVQSEEWVSFPGGELEGKRPKAMCAACREALKREARSPIPSRASASVRPLCFQCYRAELERERALRAAGDLETTSEARFQFQLPLEPVNRARLDMLKADRADARAAASLGAGQYVDRRRRAQIEARRALQAIAAGVRARGLAHAQHARAMDAAIHAAELQLPEAWLPFVVSR
jgi:hypothetical protein